MIRQVHAGWWVRLYVLLVLLVIFPLLLCAQPTDLFSAEERKWMAEHPIIYVAAEPNWHPIEYVEGGKYKGLSAEYLNEITRKTGLKFERVLGTRWGNVISQLDNGSVDLLPAVLPGLTSPEVSRRITFSNAYHVGTTIVVTRDEESVIFEFEKLNGKRVALKGGGAYEAALRTCCPGSHILPMASEEEALIAVATGNADVAVGMDAALLPLLRQKYSHILSISGMFGDMPAKLGMGIRRDLPILRSIIQKSLGSMTAIQTDHMVDHWLSQADYGAPSVSVLIRYYGFELTSLILLFCLILWLFWRARVERKRALQSERAKAMFFAVVSHEIRTPMNAVLGSIELLARTSLNVEQRRLADVATNGAEILLSLLDNVLDVSKLEAGQLMLELIPTDVDTLTRRVMGLTQAEANRKGLDMQLSVQVPKQTLLLLDPIRLQQVIHNLLANAVKFTEHGHIRITLVLDVEDPTSREGKPGTLTITVTDTGIGISTEQQKRLFEPFTQADESTTRRFGGTGLGLTICRELVSLMDGTIVLTSEPGLGTTFCVRIPTQMQAALLFNAQSALSAPVANTGVDSAVGSDKIRHPKILVVEDQPANRLIIGEQLQQLGCIVSVSMNGSDALSQQQGTDQFDMILLDCNLPDIDGYKVAAAWRAYERAHNIPPIPIIAISAVADTDHQVKCIAAGMDGMLKKPLRFNQLRELIVLWCEPCFACSAPVTPVPNLSLAQLPQVVGESLREDASLLQQAIKAQDVEVATHYAHRIMGAAQTIGRHELEYTATQLEALLKSGSTVDSASVSQAVAAVVRSLSH